jgi:hypothetical protein
MLRRIARYSAPFTLIVPAALAWLGGCGGADVTVAEMDDAAPPAFAAPDAESDAIAMGTTAYCPSNRCPPGHTTCPSSQFLCDVDLRTDLNNCGECGNRCPSDYIDKYVCVEGRCLLSCTANRALDCDGIPDNGCETSPADNDNCGYCGNQCPADKSCVDRGNANYACGCKPGEINCGGRFPCVDPSNDDANCGACRNACPRRGDGTVQAPPNAYFGCSKAECGQLKCQAYFGDCDRLTDLTNNGCETRLTSDDNCGACGNKCENGTTCRLAPIIMAPQCMCPEGLTLCEQGCLGDLCVGACNDLSSDKFNCGACGVRCSENVPNADEACVYGRCDWSCNAGWGDCNGNRDDGCETNISSDPKNCGGCGIVCDGIAGQSCVDGRCMVEPCDELQDAGGPPR